MRAWQKIFAMLFFLVAIFAVLLPDTLSDIANIFGVGRGADLLLYLLVLAFISFAFTMYVKDTHDKRRLVRLVRSMAIAEASQSSRNQELRQAQRPKKR